MAWPFNRSRRPSRAERRITFTKAHLLVGDQWIEIGIGNVSETGLMARSAQLPTVGTEVEIRRRGTVIYGYVVWSANSRFGVSSQTPIDVDGLLAGSDLQRRSVAEHPESSLHSNFWKWQTR